MRRVDLSPVDRRQRHVIGAALTEGGKREADLTVDGIGGVGLLIAGFQPRLPPAFPVPVIAGVDDPAQPRHILKKVDLTVLEAIGQPLDAVGDASSSEEHTSELTSLMRISSTVLCLKTTTPTTHT